MPCPYILLFPFHFCGRTAVRPYIFSPRSLCLCGYLFLFSLRLIFYIMSVFCACDDVVLNRTPQIGEISGVA